eukprot:751713-Hanusia_phi.AAC.1
MAARLPAVRLLEERREGRGGEGRRRSLMREGEGEGSAWKSKKELVLLEELKQLRLNMLKEKERLVLFPRSLFALLCSPFPSLPLHSLWPSLPLLPYSSLLPSLHLPFLSSSLLSSRLLSSPLLSSPFLFDTIISDVFLTTPKQLNRNLRKPQLSPEPSDPEQLKWSKERSRRRHLSLSKTNKPKPLKAMEVSRLDELKRVLQSSSAAEVCQGEMELQRFKSVVRMKFRPSMGIEAFSEEEVELVFRIMDFEGRKRVSNVDLQRFLGQNLAGLGSIDVTELCKLRKIIGPGNQHGRIRARTLGLLTRFRWRRMVPALTAVLKFATKIGNIGFAKLLVLFGFDLVDSTMTLSHLLDMLKFIGYKVSEGKNLYPSSSSSSSSLSHRKDLPPPQISTLTSSEGSLVINMKNAANLQLKIKEQEQEDGQAEERSLDSDEFKLVWAHLAETSPTTVQLDTPVSLRRIFFFLFQARIIPSFLLAQQESFESDQSLLAITEHNEERRGTKTLKMLEALEGGEGQRRWSQVMRRSRVWIGLTLCPAGNRSLQKSASSMYNIRLLR